MTPIQRCDEGRMGLSSLKPLISLDIHAEAPSDNHRRRRMTVLDRERERSKVVFNKQIAGRYRDGTASYDEVGVLLIVWEADDLSCELSELHALRDIFKDKFRFNTEIFRIPSERSATALSRKLADFAFHYDSPNKMAIVYYGGHGVTAETVYKGRLQLFAKQQGDWSGDPTAFFDDMIHTLKLPDTDILIIVDCCYAALAFSKEEMGKRKFELMSSVPSDVRALPPEKTGSFTRTMIQQLEILLEKYPEGFMTSQLYRKIYYEQAQHRKPLLFDQSPYDYGKLWLKPLKDKGTPPSDPDLRDDTSARGAGIQIDLKLHMSSMPDEFMLNELARAMQYLPHIKRLDFEQLHAPDAELREYIRGLAKTVALRPLIWKLRQRLQAKRLRQRGVKPSADTDCPSESSLHLKRRDTSLYDWSASELIPASEGHPRRGENIEPAPEVPYEQEQDGYSDSLQAVPVESVNSHSLGSILSVAYSIDASGLKDRIESGRDKATRYWQATTFQERIFLGGLWLFLLLCYLMTQSALWKTFFE